MCSSDLGIQVTQEAEPEEIQAFQVMVRMYPVLRQAAILPEKLREQEMLLQ